MLLQTRQGLAAPGAIARPPGPVGTQSCRRAAQQPRRVVGRRRPPPTTAAATGKPVSGGPATAPPPTPTGRKFVFAVDGKPECEEALRWAVANIFSKGEQPAARQISGVNHRG